MLAVQHAGVPTGSLWVLWGLGYVGSLCVIFGVPVKALLLRNVE